MVAGIQPSVTVEWSPTTDPLATPSWVAVTGWRKVQTDRGRQNELDEIQAGTASIVLDNRTRRFDPLYAAGPNYGNVLPMKRFRIRGTVFTVTYDIFQGFVESWDQSYVNPNDGTVEVRLVDFFDVLNAAIFSPSPYEVEVRADTPSYWWRLGEAPGATKVTDGITGKQLTAFGSPTLGSAGLVDNDPDTALSQADINTGFAARDTYIAAGTLPSFTMEAIVKTTATSGDIFTIQDVDLGMDALLFVSGTGRPFFNVFTTTGGVGTAYGGGGAAAINDGEPHHMAGTWDTSGNLKLYVDGIQVYTTGGFPGTNGPTSGHQEFCVGNLAAGYLPGATHAEGLIGTVDEAALYQNALSAARITAHAQAALAPWAGDTTGARVGRVLDYLNVVAGDRSIDTTTSTLQSAQLGQTLLGHLFEVNEVEQGLLFITKDGKVRFRGRTGGFNLASQATFGDGAGELRFKDIGFDYSKQMIFNVIRRQNQDGALMEASDATSIGRYGRRVDEQAGLIGDSDLGSLDLANYRLSKSKDPVQRVTEIELTPERDPTGLYPQVLGREIGEQVTIKRRPQGVGTAISFDARIEGISHTITPDAWETVFRLSPADTGVFLQLDLTSGPGLDSLKLAY